MKPIIKLPIPAFKVKTKYALTDAWEMHRLHPDTFEIPSPEEVAAIMPGNCVKLCFNSTLDSGAERMWVEVTGPGVGTLANPPCGIKIKFGDIVHFEPRHIYAIEGRAYSVEEANAMNAKRLGLSS